MLHLTAMWDEIASTPEGTDKSELMDRAAKLESALTTPDLPQLERISHKSSYEDAATEATALLQHRCDVYDGVRLTQNAFAVPVLLTLAAAAVYFMAGLLIGFIIEPRLNFSCVYDTSQNVCILGPPAATPPAATINPSWVVIFCGVIAVFVSMLQVAMMMSQKK